MNFEWDDNKEIINLKKHGMSFLETISIFEDENLIEEYDYSHSTWKEDRYKVIGYVKDVGMVVVIYQLVEEDLMRIISARNASNEERKIYEKKNILRRS